MITLVITLLACSTPPPAAMEAPAEAAPPPPPAPSFTLPEGDTLKVNDACSTLFESCTRLTCTVENRGNAAGQARVELSVTRDNGPVLTQVVTSDHIAGNGGVAKVTYDFKDTSMSDTNIVGHCRLVE